VPPAALSDGLNGNLRTGPRMLNDQTRIDAGRKHEVTARGIVASPPMDTRIFAVDAIAPGGA